MYLKEQSAATTIFFCVVVLWLLDGLPHYQSKVLGGVRVQSRVESRVQAHLLGS